ALVLVSLALALGGAEAIYRARVAHDDAPDGGDDDWRRRYRHMNETIYRRSGDPELVYEPVPSSAVEMEYGRAAFNAAGMRDDREFPIEHGARTRVVMLGDSLVWSEFVALEDSLPRRTEGALGSDQFEVLGFGVTGYDTAQEARWYERAARAFDADVVVLVWCMNDLMIMSGPFERFADAGDRARKDAQEAEIERVAPLRRETLDDELERRERASSVRIFARALGIWERWSFASSYVDEYLVMARDEARWERVERALARLGAMIREDDARAVFVISPVLESWDRYQWSAMHDRVRAAAEDAGFVVVDPLVQWRDEGQDAIALRIGGDNLHYGRTGNRALGETIAAAVREGLADE
nr:GDSL-type esterase/lipase family protein [Myxococcota bacterium]